MTSTSHGSNNECNPEHQMNFPGAYSFDVRAYSFDLDAVDNSAFHHVAPFIYPSIGGNNGNNGGNTGGDSGGSSSGRGGSSSGGSSRADGSAAVAPSFSRSNNVGSNGSVNATTIKAELDSAIAAANKTAILHADTLGTDGKIQGRLSIEPAKLTTGELKLVIYVQDDKISSVKNLFEILEPNCCGNV